MALRLYLVAWAGGISQIVLGFSSAAKERTDLADLSSGSINLRGLSGIAEAGAAWILMEALRTKQHRSAAAIVFFLTVLSSYGTAGKRLVLLLPLLAVAIALHEHLKPLRLSYAPVAFVAVLLVGDGLTNVSRVFLPANLSQTGFASGPC